MTVGGSSRCERKNSIYKQWYQTASVHVPVATSGGGRDGVEWKEHSLPRQNSLCPVAAVHACPSMAKAVNFSKKKQEIWIYLKSKNI